MDKEELNEKQFTRIAITQLMYAIEGLTTELKIMNANNKKQD